MNANDCGDSAEKWADEFFRNFDLASARANDREVMVSWIGRVIETSCRARRGLDLEREIEQLRMALHRRAVGAAEATDASEVSLLVDAYLKTRHA